MSVTREHSQWSTRDGLNLVRTTWQGISERATILLVHGYAEHGGRYDRLARVLASGGYRVETYDQRGHGQSDGHPVLIQDYHALLEDLDGMVALVRPKQGPFFIFGHSMGGGLLAHYAARFAPEVSGLVFSAPAIMVPDPPSALLRFISSITSRLMPKGPVPAFFYALDANTISRIPEEVRAYEEDPLVHRGPLLNATGWQLTKMMDECLPLLRRITAPLLVLHGTNDRLVDPRGSDLLATDASSVNLTHKTYEDGHHELFNDLCREEVTRDLLQWLHQREEA